MSRRTKLALAVVALLVLLIGAGVLLVTRQAPAPSTAATGESITIIDDVGRTVTLRKPVRRVVVYNRYTTEFIRAVGAMDTVVGADIDSNKDEGYWRTVTKDMYAGASQSQPNYEKIVSLQPDVVFMPRNGVYEETIQKMAPFGIPVVVITGWDVLKHEYNVDLLGRIFDKPAEAAKLNAFYRHYRNLLAERLKGVERKRVYLEEVGDYKTLLPGSGFHDMVQEGGGLNVFGDVNILNQASARGTVQGFTVDPEEIIARRPDVIIKLEPRSYLPTPRETSVRLLGALAARPGFSQMKAVTDGEVYHMSYYMSSGASKITGALLIAKWLYPERFTDIDPSAVMDEWLETYQHVPRSKDYWTSLKQLRASGGNAAR